MAALTVLTAQRASNGQLLTGVAAAGGGDTFVNDGKTLFTAKNASGGSLTLTFVTPVTVDGLAVTDLTVVLAAGEQRVVGPFPPAWYNDTGVAGGSVSVTYSGVTSLTVQPISMTPVA